MCGRLACGLQPQEICYSCCYKSPKNTNYKTPEWKDFYNSGNAYKPSYNVSPTDVAPVLLSGKHFRSDSRIVAPMVFGVIPKWRREGSTKYSTINCRIETSLASKLYGSLLEKGQRCAVVCNGFYEWQKQAGNRKPYFIHGKQADDVAVDDPNTWKIDFSPENGCSGFQPLKLAAVFEIDSHDLMNGATLSFAVITKEASSHTSWLHDREPAVLETDMQLEAWLNYEEFDAKRALSFLLYKYEFIFVPVSNLVNKNTNKDISCIKTESEKEKGDKKKSASFFKNWLQRGEKRKSSEESENAPGKLKQKYDVTK